MVQIFLTTRVAHYHIIVFYCYMNGADLHTMISSPVSSTPTNNTRKPHKAADVRYLYHYLRHVS